MNGKPLPAGYKMYKYLMEKKGVKAYLTPSAYKKVGALQAYEAFIPNKPQAVIPKIRAKKRLTGGISGLF